MAIDLSKLPEAPWKYAESRPRNVTLKRRHWLIGVGEPRQGGRGVALAFGEDETVAMFVTLARQAFAGDPEALAWWEANRVKVEAKP